MQQQHNKSYRLRNNRNNNCNNCRRDVTSLKTITSSGGVHALTITITDTSASASDLNTIDSLTSLNVTATAIENITSSDIADVKTLVTNATSAGIDTDWNVVISNETLSASDVKAVNAGTSGTINISNATTINGTTDDILEIVNNTGATFVTHANYATTLSDEATATEVNTIANDTGGIVTATVTQDTASNLKDALQQTDSSDKLTLKLTDTNLTSVDDILTLTSKTSEAIDASSVTDIADDYTDLNTLYNSSKVTGLGNEKVTINDEQSATNVNNILGKTSAVVTATVTAAAASDLKIN